MDPSETYAEEILANYEWLITGAAREIALKIFAGKYNGNLYEVYESADMGDVLQVTREVMLGYAGIRVEKSPHHFGKLHTLSEQCGVNPAGRKHFLGVLHKMLIADVCQNIGREFDKTFESKRGFPESIHHYEETNGDGRENDSLRIDAPDPNIDVERDAVESTRGAPERKLSARFPLLWLREVDGYTEAKIGEQLGITQQAVNARIKLEKIQARKDPGNTPTSLARGDDVSKDAPFTLGELQRCDLQRNGLGPKRGHCKWCDRAIWDAAVTDDDRHARKYTNPGSQIPAPKYWEDIGSRKHGPATLEYWRDTDSYQEWQLGGNRDDGDYIPWHAVEHSANVGHDTVRVGDGFPGTLPADYYVDMALDYQEHPDSPAWFTSYLYYGEDAAVDIYATLDDIHNANKKAPLRKEWSQWHSSTTATRLTLAA